MDDEVRQRFFVKTKLASQPRAGMETPCLEWTAVRHEHGYGQFSLGDKMEKAHRVAWKIAHGPIPRGMCVLHRCDNPPCVAEEHLFLGTQADNVADRDAKGRQVSTRGDAHWSRLHPERRPRGDTSGPRMHPECMARGEKHVRAKLTENNVRFIFQLRSQGWTQRRLASEFGVSQAVIWNILARKIWAHVDLKTGEPSL
jgi:hypothetical protein